MFKTIKEIYEALSRGKKISRAGWLHQYIELNEDGYLVNEADKPAEWSFRIPTEWKIYERQKVKTRHYVYAHSTSNSTLGAPLQVTTDLDTLEKRILLAPDTYKRLPGLDQDVEG